MAAHPIFIVVSLFSPPLAMETNQNAFSSSGYLYLYPVDQNCSPNASPFMYICESSRYDRLQSGK